MQSETILLLILILLLFVLYYFSSCKSENFEGNGNANTNMKTNSESVTLLVFLTKTCPHCIHYDSDTHADLSNELSNNANIKIKRVYADSDPDNLFHKNDIQFVPAGLVVKGEKTAKVNGEINFDNVVSTSKQL